MITFDSLYPSTSVMGALPSSEASLIAAFEKWLVVMTAPLA